MSKRIARLLDRPEKEIRKLIMQLEDKNGYPSHDVRHLAENIQAVRRKVNELGLDADDTTAAELYHALLAKFEADSLRFDIAHGFHSTDFYAKANKAIEIISAGSIMPQRWVLKNSAARQLLKQQPPKRLMKQMSYRSLDSMLKRENVRQLFVMAHLIESAAWSKELARLVAKLDSTAFEVREITIGTIETEGLNSSAPLIYNDEVGQLAIVDSEVAEAMTLLAICVQLENFLLAMGGSFKISADDGSLKWWNQTEHLLAELESRTVSLNLKDASLNYSHRNEFAEQHIAGGQAAFWKRLIGRYENQLEIEEDRTIDGLSQVFSVKAPSQQPAFEYVEDF